MNEYVKKIYISIILEKRMGVKHSFHFALLGTKQFCPIIILRFETKI